MLHTCWQYSLVTSRCERGSEGSGGGNVERDKEGKREGGGESEDLAGGSSLVLWKHAL